MKVEASAPSNIALIKYMGKSSTSGNLPANASISYTLEHLRSFVTLEEAPQDSWAPLAGFSELKMSDTGRQKFLAHFARLKELWGVQGGYLIRSANNFPADCGIASSASSFAALTLASHELAMRRGLIQTLSAGELSRLSRLGSGSSCRSFFTPWALWRSEGAEPVTLNMKLQHAVVLVGEEKKAVSSSEAHLRVTSSLLYRGRTQRAEDRLRALTSALQSGSWKDAFEICWSEFWDMHVLFETSQPSFGYMNANSLQVLNQMRQIWREEGDGPLVTMDAGPNVHLLLRNEQIARAKDWLHGMNHLQSWE